MLCAARKAAPIYADWSGFILFSHKHGDSKGIQSLWQGFGDSVPITNPSETRHKDVSAARMLFRMREDACLPANVGFLSVCELLCNSLRGALYRRAPLSEKRSTGSFYRIHPCGAPKAGEFRTLRSATKGRRPLETCELLKKLDQNFYFGFAVCALSC